MDVQEEETYERAEVVDLSDIQLPVPGTQLEDIHALGVHTDIVEVDFSEDSWQKPYMY